MFEDYKNKAEEKMHKNFQGFKARLRPLRTGRAKASLLDPVEVVYYGTFTPVSQMANISLPDARTLLINPFDPQTLKDIEQALVKANLGVTPQNDGKVIRLIMPELTEERRKELAKGVRKEAEKCRVDLRMSRRAINEEIKTSVKAKQLSEDDQKRLNAEIQKITDSYIQQTETLLKAKEKEILEI